MRLRLLFTPAIAFPAAAPASDPSAFAPIVFGAALLALCYLVAPLFFLPGQRRIRAYVALLVIVLGLSQAVVLPFAPILVLESDLSLEMFVGILAIQQVLVFTLFVWLMKRFGSRIHTAIGCVVTQQAVPADVARPVGERRG